MCISSFPREGNGTPLRYSCLENPMDGGAWWVAVHGVAGSRTWLSNFTFTFNFHALEKEMATHSSVLAWRIPGMVEPDGLPSMGLHRRLKRLSSSSSSIQFSQHHLLKRLSFPHEWSCHSCQKSFDHVCEGVLMSLFYSIGLYFCLMPVPCNFDYCVFSESFEIKKWVLQICSFFSTLFWLCWEPCKCVWNIGLFFFFLQKKKKKVFGIW